MSDQNTSGKSPHRTNKAGSGIAWAWIELEAAKLAREKAGKHGFAVYCALCILEAKAGQNHKARFTASISEISEISGLGKMSVCQAIKILRDSDLMTVDSGGLPEKSNLFTLHNIKSATRTYQVREADKSSPPHGHQIKGRKDSSPSGKESLSSVKGGKSRRRSARNSSAAAGISSSAALPPEKKADETHSIFNNF